MKRIIIMFLPLIMLVMSSCNAADSSSGLFAEDLPPGSDAYILTDDGKTFSFNKDYPDNIKDLSEKYKTARIAVYVGDRQVYVSDSFDLISGDKLKTASRIEFNCQSKSVSVHYGYLRKIMWFTPYGWLGMGILLIIVCNAVLNSILYAYGDFRMSTGWMQRVIFLFLSLPNVLTTVLAFWILRLESDYGGTVILMLILVLLINIFYISLALKFFFKEPQELRQKPLFLDKPEQLKQNEPPQTVR